MTFKELVDMKKTFENVNKVRLIISEVNTEYADFDRVFYKLLYSGVDNKSFKLGFNIETTMYDYKDIVDDSYSNYKVVNKDSIKYDSSGYGYMLMSTDLDTIMNIIGDVDINKNNEYAVFWNEQGVLRCIVNYNLMSMNKQKVVDDLIYKYYTKMNEIYIKEHNDKAKVDFTSPEFLLDFMFGSMIEMIVLVMLKLLNMHNMLELIIIGLSLIIFIVAMVYSAFKNRLSYNIDYGFEVFQATMHPEKRKKKIRKR